jgi:ribosome recycling factor
MKISTVFLSFCVVSSTGFVQNSLNQVPFVGRLGTALFAESIDLIAMEADDRMSKSIDSVKQNLGTIRTGRASPAMLDRVKCEYYGVETPISQMATISVPSAQQLSISPYDKSSMGAIERAIVDAQLGLNPMNDGSVIRLEIPALTEDRRKEMLKMCKVIGEEGKVALRNIRRDGVDTIKKLEKSKEVGEDEMKDGLDEMQKMTDKRVKEIEDIVAKKEKEVMTV